MANTGSLTTNLNSSPYWDDTDFTNNYVRFLYKPSMAVQARELTGSMSTLQNQIDKFAEHIFKEGAIAADGKVNVDFEMKYLQVKDRDTSNNTLNVAELVGTKLTSANTGMTAEVFNYATGTEASAPDTKILFIKYTSSGTSNNTLKLFTKNEQLVSNSGVTFTVFNSNTASGNSTIATITQGIVFAKDHFIYFPAQSVIVNKFDNAPTAKVGFLLDENIVTSDDDSNLLDPASGSTNFAAPGADRLKITATLTSYDEADFGDVTADFVELVNIKSGVIEKFIDKTQYSTIRDEFARRTYDESGNYYVRGLNVSMREHLNDGVNFGLYTANNSGNSSQIAVGVEPGKAYVYGYEVERLVTSYVPIDKGINYKSLDEQLISSNYGNYVLVDEFVGSPNFNDGITVSLYNAPGLKITKNLHSSTGANGTLLGTAILKAMEYESGIPGANSGTYRAYLTNVKMSNASFSSVKSIYYNNASTADVVMDIKDLPAVLQEKQFNTMVFEIPSKNVRTIRDTNGDVDTSFTFKKTFNVSIATPGTFTINTGAADEIFPFGTGFLNSSQKRDNIMLTFNTAATVDLTGTISGTSSANTFTGSGTAFTSELNVGDTITVNGQTRRVVSIASNSAAGIAGTWSGSFAANTYVRSYAVGDVIDLSTNGDGAVRTVEITSSTEAAVDLKETLSTTVSATATVNLTKTDAQEIKKTLRKNRYVIIRANTHPTTVSGPYGLGFSDVIKINSVRKKTGSTFTTSSEGTDVTTNFILDTGQKDDIYDHARLRKNAGYSIGGTDYLLVDLNYFEHDTSQGVGYYSVDSYPVDDVNGAANTNAITTAEIPLFTSPTTGKIYSLRDCIDIRNAKIATANSSTTVAGATTNPADTTTLVAPTGGIRTATPNETFTFDYSYYLPRKDIVVIDRDGKIQAVRGIPNLIPASPEVPADTMVLAELQIAPFPSLPSSIAVEKNRPEYANKIRNIAIRRYTMEQIGLLEKRIENLEYYTALNFLEKETFDTKILDDNGLDRFKNGILVDPFNDHRIGDTRSPDYKIAVDRAKSEIRPTFELDDVGNEYISVSGAVKTTNLVTLPYTHAAFISQLSASTSRNAAGLYYSYRGNLTLSPESDYWTDTTRVPDLQITENNDLSNWQNLANAWGTDWGDWTNNWASTSVNSSSSTNGNATTTTTTNTTTTGQVRSGTQLRVTSSIVTQNYGDRVIDVSVVPFMRARSIQFTARGMKPNTKVYATFDGEDVDAYVTQTNSSFVAQKARGEPLIVDSTGTLYGIFLLPNDDTLRFRTGTKMFRLNDNPTGLVQAGLSTTLAEAEYTASGLNQSRQNTIVSTVVPRVTSVNVSDTRTQVSSTSSSATTVTNTIIDNPSVPIGGQFQPWEASTWFDPIAQTFTVKTPSGVPGAFFTKIDLYFATKHPTLGVEFEIREVNAASQLTRNVVPYSRTRIAAASINVSDDASSITTITFPAPVFLLNNTEYAFVVKPEAVNDQTSLWVAKLGELDLDTGLKITKQPYSGVLYASSNDGVFEPIQDEDIKFKLYRAVFTTGFGSVTFGNESVDYLKMASTASNFEEIGEEIHGNVRAVLSSVTGGAVANTDILVGQTSTTRGTVYTISGSNVRLKNVDIGEAYTSGETVTVLYANGSAKGVTASIGSITIPKGNLIRYYVPDSTNIYMDVKRTNSVVFSINEEVRGQTSNSNAIIGSFLNKKMNLINPQSSEINLSGTSVEWSVKMTSNASVLDSEFTTIQNNNDYVMDEEKILMSRTNEINNLSSNRSLQYNASLYTAIDYISPVVDISRAHTMYVHNIVNNDSTNETGKIGGNALARYISQKTTLAEGQDAEDLKVFVTSYRPPNSDVKVYAKMLNINDSDAFDDLSWKELELASKNVYSDTENRDDFKEYEFTIPAASLTGSNDEYQYVNSQGVTFTGYKYFAVKIVLLSTNSVHVPRCRDMRAICLQR